MTSTPGMISASQARLLLAPYERTLLECVEAGWNRWLTKVGPQLAVPTKRGRANAIWELVIDELRSRLGSVPDIRFLEKAGRVCLVVQEAVLLRFKLLGHQGLPRTYPTNLALMFDRQLPIASIPDVARITLGYKLDELATELRDVTVSLIQGTRIHWSYSLMSAANPVTLPLPLPIAPQVPGTRVRVKPGVVARKPKTGPKI